MNTKNQKFKMKMQDGKMVAEPVDSSEELDNWETVFGLMGNEIVKSLEAEAGSAIPNMALTEGVVESEDDLIPTLVRAFLSYDYRYAMVLRRDETGLGLDLFIGIKSSAPADCIKRLHEWVNDFASVVEILGRGCDFAGQYHCSGVADLMRVNAEENDFNLATFSFDTVAS